MDFLNGYIGLSGSLDSAESGLYIDELPDISLIIAGKIIRETNELTDLSELWALIEKRGILKFRTLFISEINRCHRINKAEICECLIENNMELLATSLWYLLGAEFMHERATSSRINRFTTIERQKAVELRAEFMDLFHSELSVAVAGISIHDSECTADEVIEENNIITTHIPII